MADQSLRLESLDEYLCRTCQRLIDQARGPHFREVAVLFNGKGYIHGFVGQDEKCSLCRLLGALVGQRRPREDVTLLAFAHAGSSYSPPPLQYWTAVDRTHR